MALISLFTKSPSFRSSDVSIEFDAVLNDTFEASVSLTEYPVEFGANANDHRIRNPYRYQLIGAVSNNPIQIIPTDFGGLLGQIRSNNQIISASASIFTGWLSGSTGTRGADALDSLLQIMNFGDPFDVDAGDIQLKNMVIESIRRDRDNTNDGGLIFVANLVEWRSIETVISASSFKTNAISGTDTASAAANFRNNGEVTLSSATETAINTISGWFNG